MFNNTKQFVLLKRYSGDNILKSENWYVERKAPDQISEIFFIENRRTELVNKTELFFKKMYQTAESFWPSIFDWVNLQLYFYM